MTVGGQRVAVLLGLGGATAVLMAAFWVLIQPSGSAPGGQSGAIVERAVAIPVINANAAPNDSAKVSPSAAGAAIPAAALPAPLPEQPQASIVPEMKPAAEPQKVIEQSPIPTADPKLDKPGAQRAKAPNSPRVVQTPRPHRQNTGPIAVGVTTPEIEKLPPVSEHQREEFRAPVSSAAAPMPVSISAPIGRSNSAPPPAEPRPLPQSVESQCADRGNFVSKGFCQSQLCSDSKRANDKTCKYLRGLDQARAQIQP
jgi:hypothetical protein